jgi:hypothetical protein
VSAYDAVEVGAEQVRSGTRVAISRLTESFRLLFEIRQLIQPVCSQDGISLNGWASAASPPSSGGLGAIWQGYAGPFLIVIVHNERDATMQSRVEEQLALQVLQAVSSIGDRTVALITPHLAQRTLLRSSISQLTGSGGGPVADLIDTVEKLQGWEKRTIIVSAIASEPSTISRRAEFLLELNRTNVAFSRTQERLVVICSESLLNRIPADVEEYDNALLWKNLPRC